MAISLPKRTDQLLDEAYLPAPDGYCRESQEALCAELVARAGEIIDAAGEALDHGRLQGIPVQLGYAGDLIRAAQVVHRRIWTTWGNGWRVAS